MGSGSQYITPTTLVLSRKQKVIFEPTKQIGFYTNGRGKSRQGTHGIIQQA
jgi:hypothetical protein